MEKMAKNCMKITKSAFWGQRSVTHVNHGIVRNLKNLNISRTEHNFPIKQKVFNLCLGWHILRSYCFVSEETIKSPKSFFTLREHVNYSFWFS